MEHKKIKAILTFDLEFWHSGTHKRLLKNENLLEDYIEESLKPILDLLKKHKARATFFVLGELAEKYPKLIKEIYQNGHEIASHGYSHNPLEKLSEKDFENEIILSKKILKEITGKNPISFRAPYFSLNNKTKWALKVLEEQDFRYDSSIFPLKTPLYGMKNVPLIPYKISEKLLEIPVTILKWGLIKIPLAGGIYFRFLPNKILLPALKFVAQKRIPVLYFHPHDLCNIRPKIKSVYRIKKKDSWLWGTRKNIWIIISYIIKKSWFWGTKKGLKKFEKLFYKFDFISVEEYFKTFKI